MTNGIGETKTCAKCGKKFVPAPLHIFKDKKKWYCKWTVTIIGKTNKSKKGGACRPFASVLFFFK